MDTIPTIAEAARLIAAKELSAVELTKDCIARMESYDDTLHAFILPTEERALADARAAETRVMAGNAKGDRSLSIRTSSARATSRWTPPTNCTFPTR